MGGEVAHLFLQPVGWNEPVDHPEPVRVGGLQRLAAEKHLVRDACPGEPRQQPADAAVRSEADVDERLEDVGLGRCDADVARERKAGPDAHRGTVHRGDHRLRHRPQAHQDRHVLSAQYVADVLWRAHARARSHFSHVGAR